MDTPVDSHHASAARAPDAIGAVALISIFLRSLTIQSSWNFSRMQNVGFLYSLIPLARKLQRDEKSTKEMLARHGAFFNTHPYFSSPILGSVVALETGTQAGPSGDPVQLKSILMSPYAAAGDPFFWGAMKPLAAVTGVILALKGYVWAPLVVLFLYNPVHVWFRVRGFIEGYRDGKGAYEFMHRINFPLRTKRVRGALAVLLAGLAVEVSAMLPVDAASVPPVVAGISVLSVILFCYWLISRGVASHAILYGAALFFLVISIAGTV